MDAKSQKKVCNAGFIIIRADDHPQPRIKYKNKVRAEWETLEKFETKAARNRRFNKLLELELVISD